MIDTLTAALQSMNGLEFAGLASGLLCVYLLIKQNIWTFPIGLLYSVISVWVFTVERLYADVLLSVFYVVMNAYGWYYWHSGRTRVGSSSSRPLPVRHIPKSQGAWLTAIAVAGIASMGWFLDTRTDADLAYWDSGTTVMSFIAMWMTARKYIENWWLWFVVDVIATLMYLYKGIGFYAVLYGVYLLMAIWGWQSWRRSLTTAPSSV